MEDGLAAALLRRLRDHGPQTKAALADHVGQPRTTVSAVVRRLYADGVLEDGPPAPSSGGRRSVTVRIAARRVFVAVSLGERRARVATVSGQLGLTGGVSIDLAPYGVEVADAAAAIATAVDELLADARPEATVVAAADPGGPLAVSVLAQVCRGRDDVPLSVLPSARAMALGERHAGLFRGYDDLVALRLGQGVTAATFVDGRLLGGADGRAGEVGHVQVEEFGPVCTCGRTGCLDAFAGASAIADQATALARRGRSETLATMLAGLDADRLAPADVVAAVEAGDPVAVQLARDVGQRVGQALAGLVAATGARGVVLGGPTAALGTHLLNAVRTAVYRSAPPAVAADLEVVLSDIGERAVLVGAGLSAVEQWVGSQANSDETSQKLDNVRPKPATERFA
ncbi:ROK family protein [Nocardioides litoris]|uniref:ROK family protein n=1 Tax=Nocardioides litoris TaxID=1926648 RepID=UPI00112097D3|nr:ROK family protein [Nocardioides litoris]